MIVEGSCSVSQLLRLRGLYSQRAIVVILLLELTLRISQGNHHKNESGTHNYRTFKEDTLRSAYSTNFNIRINWERDGEGITQFIYTWEV